ncbi:DinB family protein [Gillisia sp. CAL575]|uniref:DinB family protein n=1 Tax=Gillisia sp. CAL575 TaxID=985255 RepID=UPI0003A5C985|nr:DinB family protein [Gillisia sp. CAL575]
MTTSQLQNSEYHAFYQTYIDKLPDENLISILKDQKEEFVIFLKGLQEEDLKFSYAEGKWTVAQSLQHIIDTERIFQYRALTIAREDLTPLPGFDHDAYVPASKADRRSLSGFIREFEMVRDAGIALFESFQEEMYCKIGEASKSQLSPRAAGFISAGHQKHHLVLFKSQYGL